jgi:MbeD/MobD like.
MTELETQLLSALEQLQNDYAQQLAEWENVCVELRAMYGRMQQDNATLSGQVQHLGKQVQILSAQLSRLSR